MPESASWKSMRRLVGAAPPRSAIQMRSASVVAQRQAAAAIGEGGGRAPEPTRLEARAHRIGNGAALDERPSTSRRAARSRSSRSAAGRSHGDRQCAAFARVPGAMRGRRFRRRSTSASVAAVHIGRAARLPPLPRRRRGRRGRRSAESGRGRRQGSRHDRPAEASRLRDGANAGVPFARWAMRCRAAVADRRTVGLGGQSIRMSPGRVRSGGRRRAPRRRLEIAAGPRPALRDGIDKSRDLMRGGARPGAA